MKKLSKVLNDYVDYLWDFPEEKNKCKLFVKNILSEKLKVRRKKYFRLISKEKINLEKLSKLLEEFYDIKPLLYYRINGLGTVYYELNINRRDYVQKLIDEKIIPNIFKAD